jgi:hypothetical protein
MSLRALLLALLVLGAILGWRVNRAREQRLAVSVIERNGGVARYDWQFVNDVIVAGRRPPGPRWLRRLIGDEYFQEVWNVVLHTNHAPDGRELGGFRPVDEVVQCLRAFPTLKDLYIHRRGASDLALEAIGSLDSLETVAIASCPNASDAGVAHLRGLKRLKELFIEDARLSDVGLSHLFTLPSLETLCVSNVRFSGKAQSRATRPSNLGYLEVWSSNERIERNGFGCLSSLKSLSTFILHDATLSEENVLDLRSLPNNMILDLSSSRAPNEGIRQLKANRPDLDIVRPEV